MPSALFTPENARAKQAAGVAARLARKKLANASQMAAGIPFEPVNLTVNGNSLSGEVETLQNEMRATLEQMKGLTAGGKRLQLALAYSKLFSAWQTLVGLEKPATRKRGTQRRGDPSPWQTGLVQNGANGHETTQPVESAADWPGNNSPL